MIVNSQIFIPNISFKYIETLKEDEEQESIALCTLIKYSTSITHCVELALYLFEEYFVKIIRDLKIFC